MESFILKEITNCNIEKELQDIGFDEGYKFVASDKFRYKNIKIFNLSPAQANILKQTALTVGADCATHREVIRGNIEQSNVILCGSYSQLKKIVEKIAHQPFKMNELGIKINKIVELKKQNTTKITGILNITPNSFSDGGKYLEPKEAQKHLIQLIEDGADIIDIGAESTKPYSEAVSAEEQIKRLKPILSFILEENIKTPISIDTRSSVVAEYALNNGASIINDVSGFDYDKKLAEIVSKYKAEVIIQHSLGTPKIMQNNPQYNNLIEEIFFSLKNKIEYAKNIGIKKIIIDPGIGFGKTKQDNLELINRAEEFYSLDCPIMIGLSRKSFLGINDDNNDIKDALSLAYSFPLIKKKVDYIRVHNVKLHKALINSLNIQ